MVILLLIKTVCMLSVLWYCWLGTRKSIRPAKKIQWCDAVMVICLERGADDLHMVQLMSLPPHHLLLRWNRCRLTQVVLKRRPLNGS